MPCAGIAPALELAVRLVVAQPPEEAGGDAGDEVPADRHVTIGTCPPVFHPVQAA